MSHNATVKYMKPQDNLPFVACQYVLFVVLSIVFRALLGAKVVNMHLHLWGPHPSQMLN